MGKRSTFGRVSKDFYPTPYKAIAALLPHLPPVFTYDEPCAGDGALIRHLSEHGGVCVDASDISPMYPGIHKQDVFHRFQCFGDMFITNPPWDRDLLHPMIIHLSLIAPTWLLFDADWKHTIQAGAFSNRCRKVVSVGRVKWIPNSGSVGKDNVAWYLFDKPCDDAPTKFYWR